VQSCFDLFTHLCHDLVHDDASVGQQGRNEFKVVKPEQIDKVDLDVII
jgi:hypothetical protein